MNLSLPNKIFQDRITLAVFTIMVSMTLANLGYDLMVGGIYSKGFSSIWGVLLFIITSALAFVAGVYVTFRFINPLSAYSGKSNSLSKRLNKILIMSFFVICGILILIVLQLLTSSQYSVDLYMIFVAICFFSAAIIFIQNAFKFFSWYRSNKNFVIILYACTFLLVAVGIISIIAISGGVIIVEKGGKKVDPTVVNTTSTLTPGIPTQDSSIQSRLYNTVSLPIRAAYIVYWLANVLLMRNYISKIGKMKFWILVGLPLVLNISSGFLIVLSSETTGTALLGLSFLTAARIGIAISTTISGVLFAIVYFTVSRSMKNVKQAKIQKYLKCCAYGTMIVVISLTLPLSTLLYPPFALISWAFMGFGAYLVSTGFYSIAISISEDIMLRKTIRTLVISESRLFDSMGTAQMNLDLQGRVSKVVKEQEEEMEKHSEITPSLTEEEMRGYLEEVIKEVRASRKRK